jgi:UDP-N-acetyl-D-mannosaminuronic acid dehydrogenase
MSNKNTSSHVSIVGGGGHIGLPLSCYIQNKGYQVLIVDNNIESINSIRKGKAPFFEEGLDKNLKNALKGGLTLTNKVGEIKFSNFVIVTIGTSSSKKSIDLFDSLINQILKNMENEASLILRSTVTENDIEKIKKNKHYINKNIKLTYCPERIAEGLAFEELGSLKQIIGADNEENYKIIQEFFLNLNIKSINTSIKYAVFIKLFSNAYRHANFSIINEFHNIAFENNINFSEIKNIATKKYPRLKKLPMTGYVGGPCLPKDLETFIKSYNVNNSLLNNLAHVNEKYLDNLVKLCSEVFEDKKIIQLGLTFKSGSDDLRGSGAIILNKKLQQKGFEVLPVDPHVNKSEINFKTFDYQKIKHKTNNILIAVNHGEFNKYDLKNKIIVYGEL